MGQPVQLINSITDLIEEADPYLMPLGVAKLLIRNGYRLPQCSAVDMPEKLAKIIEPAMDEDSEEAANMSAAIAVVQAGIVR